MINGDKKLSNIYNMISFFITILSVQDVIVYYSTSPFISPK